MPVVTHDGRSFMLDGRRLWLVSGQIPYAKLCRSTWEHRVAAAKLAGLNCIETPVFWNRHEPRPGKFDFSGDNDLRAFVQTIAKAQMHCILSIGPFVGGSWDLGGLPAWLMESPNVALRTANQSFLEACSRFIVAVAEQVRSLQATVSTPGGGHGPIILLQCENSWTCGHDDLAHGYLGELVRYIREAGLAVPIVNSNNLWQGVEGQIDGWAGNRDMLSMMRQLAHVRPVQPRMVIDFPLEKPSVFGRPAPAAEDPFLIQRRLAEALAGGGQFNLRPFALGTNFGFWGGRYPDAPDAFATPVALGTNAALDESGNATASYAALRRISTFASRFGRVFASLDPAYQPMALAPGEPAQGAEAGADKRKKSGKGGSSQGQGVAVIHATGSQGAVAFVFSDEPTPRTEPRTVDLLLPDGSTMPVPLGQQSVAWCLFNTHISGRAFLDRCNLSALGSVGQVFVCFGPAGTRGVVVVNGSPLDVMVPDTKGPEIVDHEGLTVVIANEAQIDAVLLTDAAVYVGASSIASDGTVTPAAGFKQVTRLTGDGKRSAATLTSRKAHAPETLHLGPWQVAGTEDYQSGQSARYASINGPAELASMGCPYGYGWYRVALKPAAAGKLRLMAPGSSDRLHVFLDGKPAGVMGVGPGADPELSLSVRKQPHTLVILADNMGRFSGGANLADRKGLVSDLFEVERLKVAKPKIARGQPLDILTFRAPLWDLSQGDTTGPDRLTWSLSHKRKTPVIFTLGPAPAPGVVFVNDKPLAYLDRSGPTRLTLSPDLLGKSVNLVQVALLSSHGPELLARFEDATFDEAVRSLTAGAEMAFAKWEPPQPGAYGTAHKTPHALKGAGGWWRTSVTLPEGDAPAMLELQGLTKGQVMVNGHHVGRYFVATAEGDAVPPLHHLPIPSAWLKPKSANEILIFDEHGSSPSKVRLVLGRA